MTYVATINVPGYLPMDDDPPTFDTAQEAWAYLFTERTDAEDDYEDEAGYTKTRETMAFLSEDHAWRGGAPTFVDGIAADGTGTLWGDTPGYEGDHDLGLAYSVSLVEEEASRG